VTDVARPLLEVSAVSKSYGTLKAVSEISLQVRRGEILGIVGPNGAGKSTLVGIICGDVKADSGRVSVAGHDLTHMSMEGRARRGIGRCFQVPKLFLSFTTADNISLAVEGAYRRAWRVWKPHAAAVQEAAVSAALQYVGLTGVDGRQVSALSHGDRKMVELARMVAQNPLVAVLDEPTAGVSLREADRSIETIARMAADRADRCIIVTSHDLDLIRTLASRLVLVSSGSVLAEGKPAEVLASEAAQEVFLGYGD
jgi:branched-chain amino acid transport system ATP-binding protein